MLVTQVTASEESTFCVNQRTGSVSIRNLIRVFVVGSNNTKGNRRIHVWTDKPFFSQWAQSNDASTYQCLMHMTKSDKIAGDAQRRFRSALCRHKNNNDLETRSLPPPPPPPSPPGKPKWNKGKNLSRIRGGEEHPDLMVAHVIFMSCELFQRLTRKYRGNWKEPFSL